MPRDQSNRREASTLSMAHPKSAFAQSCPQSRPDEARVTLAIQSVTAAVVHVVYSEATSPQIRRAWKAYARGQRDRASDQISAFAKTMAERSVARVELIGSVTHLSELLRDCAEPEGRAIVVATSAAADGVAHRLSQADEMEFMHEIVACVVAVYSGNS
jgi:hypothetical protein